MAPKIPDEEEAESLEPNSSEVKEEEDESVGFLHSIFSLFLSDNPKNPRLSLCECCDLNRVCWWVYIEAQNPQAPSRKEKLNK